MHTGHRDEASPFGRKLHQPRRQRHREEEPRSSSPGCSCVRLYRPVPCKKEMSRRPFHKAKRDRRADPFLQSHQLPATCYPLTRPQPAGKHPLIPLAEPMPVVFLQRRRHGRIVEPRMPRDIRPQPVVDVALPRFNARPITLLCRLTISRRRCVNNNRTRMRTSRHAQSQWKG